MKKTWLYLGNQFDRATKGSFERALTISTYTDAALAADPARATEYTFYHPIHLAFVAAYNAWKSGSGSQKGATETLRILLKGIKQQLDGWDFEIQKVATKGSAAYLAIFPNGRKPFMQGKQATRIAALGTLSVDLGKMTPVPPVKDTVDEYLTDLIAVNATQKGKISTKDTLSDAVEAARVNVCQGLYYVLGKLMMVHYKDPEPIAAYFDVELIRRDKQKIFTGTILQTTHHSIVKRGLKLDEQVSIRNTGLVPLTFYLANTKDGGIPEGVTGVTLLPSETTHVPASSLGHPATDKFLSVYNASDIIEGEWEVEIN